jgi:hypothetical protein
LLRKIVLSLYSSFLSTKTLCGSNNEIHSSLEKQSHSHPPIEPLQMHIYGIPAISFGPTRDFTWVNYIEDDHDREHEQGVKCVNVILVLKQRAVTSLEVLHHPEDRPHHDEGTDSVEGPDVLLPGERAARLDRGDEEQSAVEADGDHHEEAEERELHEESDHDDVGPHFQC